MGGVPARHPIQNKLHGLGDGLHMLGNGLHMFDNGPHVLGKSTFGLMLHSGLLNTVSSTYVAFKILSPSEIWCFRNFVVFSFLSHSEFCRIWDYVVRYYVVWHYVAFGIMSFGKMWHSVLNRIQTYVVWNCVVWHNVVRVNV